MTANGIDTHVRIHGEGPRAVLFVHALGADSEIWDDVIARMPTGLRCLSYDLRGHGRTTVTPGPYALSQLSADLLAVMDRSGIAHATICGVSIGGLIAQRAALDAPGRIEELVLCDTAMRIGSAEGWQTRIDAVTARGLPAMADEITTRWYAPQFAVSDPARAAELRRRLAEMSPVGYTAACAALRDGDLREDSRHIRARTLVISGVEDVATPPAQGRELAAAIPHARFEELSGVGHLPCVEAPSRLAGLIVSFLTEAKVA